MNNLHRELAPFSDAAWSQIEEEASRTLKRYLAGRRVVDVQGPGGTALSAVGTGHLHRRADRGRHRPPARVQALVELRPRSTTVSDRRCRARRDRPGRQPVKDAARQIALPDRAIFGVTKRPASRASVGDQPADDAARDACLSEDAQALSHLRLVGVNGPIACCSAPIPHRSPRPRPGTRCCNIKRRH